MWYKGVKMDRLLCVLGVVLALTASSVTTVLAEPDDCAQTYNVPKGESLSLIALRFFGDLKAYPRIVDATNTVAQHSWRMRKIADPNKVAAGQWICLSLTRVYTPQALDPEPGDLFPPDAKPPMLGNGGYDAQSYLVDVVWTPANVITGTATMILRTTRDLSAFGLDLHGLELERLTVNGGYPFVERKKDKLVVYLLKPIAAGEPFDVQVDYRGVPGPVRNGERTSGWRVREDGAVLVCNQPFGTSSWFPSNDYPGDKAIYWFNVTVPVSYTVTLLKSGSVPAVGSGAASPVDEGIMRRYPLMPVRPASFPPNFSINMGEPSGGLECPAE